MKLFRSLLVLSSVFSLTVLLSANRCTAVPADFAYASGTNFYVNGTEFHYGGDNIYWMGLSVMGTTQAEADSEMANCEAAGVKVVRMWAFTDGTSSSLQPSIGVYNESALETLDYALMSAANHNVKVILPLTNYWTDFGGMSFYVSSVEGSHHPVTDFYTNATIQQYYQQYVGMLLNRVNVYTGVAYKDDPTIFSWELANEPRCPVDTTGDTLYNWIHTSAAFIKSIDANHMVSTGEEGFKKGGKAGDITQNGSQGDDFARNVSAANIDFAVVHLYPASWGKNNTNWVDNYLKDRASIAHNTAKKPIVLEEFGEATPDATDFRRWITDAEKDDYSGIQPWQMVDKIVDGGDDFLFTSSTGKIIQRMCTHQDTL